MSFFNKNKKWLSQSEYRSRGELIDKMIWPQTGKKGSDDGTNIILLDNEGKNNEQLNYEGIVGESFYQKTFIEADKEYRELKGKVEYYESVVEYLQEIVRSVSNRSFQIKNAIEWRKFEAGI